MNFLTSQVAARIASDRLPSHGWDDRIASMMLHAASYIAADGSDGHSRLHVQRVSKDWPRKGCIYVVREVDGVRMKLFLQRNRYRIEPA